MNPNRTPEENRIISAADRDIATYVEVIRKVQLERDELRKCALWVIEQWERGNLICHTPSTAKLNELRRLIRPPQIVEED